MKRLFVLTALAACFIAIPKQAHAEDFFCNPEQQHFFYGCAGYHGEYDTHAGATAGSLGWYGASAYAVVECPVLVYSEQWARADYYGAYAGALLTINDQPVAWSWMEVDYTGEIISAGWGFDSDVMSSWGCWGVDVGSGDNLRRVEMEEK